MSETTKQKIVRRLREGDGAGVRVRRGVRNLGAQLSGLSALAEGLALVAEVQHGLVVGHLGELSTGDPADREERREWMWSQAVDELEELRRVLDGAKISCNKVDALLV